MQSSYLPYRDQGKGIGLTGLAVGHGPDGPAYTSEGFLFFDVPKH